MTVVLKGSGDGVYPWILTIANGWGEKIHLTRAEIKHNLPSISKLKVYTVLSCKIKFTKRGDLRISDKYRCELLGLKLPSHERGVQKSFSIKYIYLELEERKEDD